MERKDLKIPIFPALIWAVYSFVTLSLPFTGYMTSLLPQWKTWEWFLYSQVCFLTFLTPFFGEKNREEPPYFFFLLFLWLPLMAALSSLSSSYISFKQLLEAYGILVLLYVSHPANGLLFSFSFSEKDKGKNSLYGLWLNLVVLTLGPIYFYLILSLFASLSYLWILSLSPLGSLYLLFQKKEDPWLLFLTWPFFLLILHQVSKNLYIGKNSNIPESDRPKNSF